MRASRLRGDLVRSVMNWLWGSLSPLGMGVAALTVLVDQVNKAWMLYVYDIAAKAPVAITPVFDLILVWNQGISYGLLQQDSDFGRWALIVFAIVTSLALTVWLSQVTSKLVAASIGLIIGGAIGNAIDRIVHGAVADFFSFHAFGYQWYIFNIADVAIVAGVVGLLCESLFGGHKKVSKPPSM